MLPRLSTVSSVIAELEAASFELRQSLSPAHRAAGERIARDLIRIKKLTEESRDDEARRIASKHLMARACGVVAA